MKALITVLIQALQGLNVMAFIIGVVGLMALGGACASGGPYEIETQCTPLVSITLGLGLPVYFVLLVTYALVRPKSWKPMPFWPAGVLMFGIAALFLTSAVVAGVRGNIGEAIGGALLGLMMAGLGAGGVWLFTIRRRTDTGVPWRDTPGVLPQVLAAFCGTTLGLVIAVILLV